MESDTIVMHAYLLCMHEMTFFQNMGYDYGKQY